MNRTKYPFHGEMLSIYQISRRLGFVRKNGRVRDSFRKKVKRLGYEEALRLTEAGKRSDNDYVVFGTASKNITEWCRIFGIHDTTVFSRLKHGWEIHAALTVPPNIKHVKRPDSLSEAARNAGLKMGTVWARRHVHGWSEEQSLSPIKREEQYLHAAEAVKVKFQKKKQASELLSLGIITH